jgi:hypothetical protein
MTRTLLFVLTIHLILYGVIYQTELLGQSTQKNPYQQESFSDRLMYGGIVGFQFSTVTYIEVSPIAGYRATRNFVPGLGFTYQFTKFNDYYINLENGETLDQKVSVIGGRLFSRFYFNDLLEGILGGLFIHGEFEFLTFTRQVVYFKESGETKPQNRNFTTIKKPTLKKRDWFYTRGKCQLFLLRDIP